MHNILKVEQGIRKGYVYVTVDIICIGLFELWNTRRKHELQNDKFLPAVGLEPITSRLLEWCFDQLRHRTVVSEVTYR